MGNLTIDDFRGAMGKYNLGGLKLEGEGNSQKLTLVNSHNRLRSVRNTVVTTGPENTAIREQFAQAIETYLRSRGFDTRAETEVGRFMAAIREDLLGDESKTRELSRTGDVARILDKLDAAVALKKFDLGKGGKVALDQRFFFAADPVQAPAAGEAFTLSRKSKATAIAEQTLSNVRDLLELDDAGKLTVDAQMLKMAMKAANISETRTMTYLTTRPETLLVKADVYLRAHLTQMNQLELNELMGGVGKANLARLALVKAIEELHVETVSAKGLSELSGNRRLAANMMMGQEPFNPTRLAQDGELNGLLTGLSRLAEGADKVKVTVLGQRMTLSKNDGKELSVEMGKVRFAAFGGANTMLHFLEGAIANGKMPMNSLKSVYRNTDYLGTGETDESRRRIGNLAAAIVKTASGLSEIELQSLSIANRVRVASAIVEGRLSTRDEVCRAVADLASTHMYSDDALKLVNDYLKAPENEKRSVVIAEARADSTPALNKLAADLFSNADVWVMDNVSEEIGGRIRETLLAHQDTLVALLKGEMALDSIPVLGNAETKEAVERLLAILKENNVADAPSLRAFLANNANALSKIESMIDDVANRAIAQIQTLFAEKMGAGGQVAKADARELWEKTLDDVIAEQQKTSGSVEAKFLDKLLKEYMKRSSNAEKRSMMASLIRLTTVGNTDVEKFSAVLKGAGPVFQKLLQGFPEELVPVGLRGVFDDMKSHLAPIPDTVVKATLARIVANPESGVSAISLDKTLGSASVGQAFLCTFTKTDGTTEKAVVKMLKPDVQNRFAREVSRLRELADEVDAEQAGGGNMRKTLEGRLSTIQEEFNFKVESQNVQDGQIYNQGETVRSVGLFPGVGADMNVLVLTLAEGDTVGNFISKTIDARLAEVRTLVTAKHAAGMFSEKFIVKNYGELQKVRTELLGLADDIARKQKLLSDLAKTWFNEAAFGKGFYHGDMHADNILVSDSKVTLIDFGNAKKLTGVEMVSLKKLICAAAAGDADKFLEGMDKLLEKSAGGAKLKEAETRRGLREFIAEVFGKGGLDDTDAKLFAALNEMQNKGIEIPAAVYNYSASQNRLKNTIASLGAKLDEVKNLLLRSTLAEEDFDQTKAKLAQARRVAPRFLPIIQTMGGMILYGFSKSTNRDLSSDRQNLDPKNRPPIVEKILETPDYAQTVIAPVLEFFGQIGVADQELGARLAAAEQAVKDASTDAARARTAVAQFVDVVQDIQLKLCADAEHANELPDNLTMGQAFSQVIQSKISDSDGQFSKLKALGFCAQIGGIDIGFKLRDKFAIEKVRLGKEKLLDDGVCYWGLNAPQDPTADNMPIYKDYALQFKFSAATKAHLDDEKFSFAKDGAARAAFLKELAVNIKGIYIKEAGRGLSPLAYRRSTEKGANPNFTLEKINASNNLSVTNDWLKKGKIEGLGAFASCLKYVYSYLHHIDTYKLFYYLQGEIEENAQLPDQLLEGVDGLIKLDEADIEAIVDARLTTEAQLRGRELKDLSPEEKTALRDEVKTVVKSDFELESGTIKKAVIDFITLVAKSEFEGADSDDDE